MILPTEVGKNKNQKSTNNNFKRSKSDDHKVKQRNNNKVIPESSNRQKSIKKGEQKQEGGFFKKTLNYLRSTYPKCFTNPISPLAIGIHKQLQEQMNIEGMPFTTKKSIHIFLHFYIDTLSYKSACIEGAERRNLDGSVHSIIMAKDIQNLEK